MSTILFFLIISVTVVKICHGDIEHDRVIIHVPYYIKTIKHIRTIVKQEEKKKNDNKWEVLGYSIGEPIIPEASEIFGHEEKYNNLLWNHDESQKKLMQLQQLAAAYKALKFGL